jgi:hypothetical protein
MPDPHPLSPARSEGTPAGHRRPGSRILLSAFLVATVAASVLSSMPDSSLRARVHPLVEPYLNTTGLGQGWGMFAPDPPRHSTELVAHITYADGSVGSWTPPDDDGLLGAYRTYRWRKWSFAARDDNRPQLQEAMADWLVRHGDHQGRRPVTVELVRRWQGLAAPGSGEADGAWRERTYLTLPLEGPDGGIRP